MRNPTANPIAVVTANPHTNMAVSPSTLPAITEARGMGRLRRRSNNPPSRSSAMPAAAFMPVNRTLVMTKPGMRKST